MFATSAERRGRVAARIRAVTPAALSLDTSPDVERMQVDAWRSMSAEQKASLVTAMTRTVLDLARAGIRDRHPDASPLEQRQRLAVILLGRELALRAFPETAGLDRS